jgi:hypothetical protein
MQRKIALLAGALVMAAGIAACADSSTSSGSGQLTIQLTDKPFPFSDVKNVDVFVVRIDGRMEDADSAEAADDSDHDWKTLVSPNASIDLLTLTGGKTANLGVVTLPEGNYRGFRMILDTDKSGVTLKDGSEPDVKWPSAGKNGIKINLNEPVVIGPGSANMLIDFDVGRSFVMRGNSVSQNGLLFKPVIHAVTQQSTGSIAGSVRQDSVAGTAVAGATVEVLKAGTPLGDTNDNNVVATTMTDASGNYVIGFIAPGTYVVRATPPSASSYKPALLTGGATVVAGGSLTGKVIVVTK